MPHAWCRLLAFIPLPLALGGCASWTELSGEKPTAQWLAGDHHVHSRFSVGYDDTVDPPTPIVGGDAIYPIPMNALMAQHHGLTWMVSTDHGGPHHSKVHLEQAYPELQRSRAALPHMVQFFGMELNVPGAEHASLIMPHSENEAIQLAKLEAAFDRREAWPTDPERNTEDKMLDALRSMDQLEFKPVVIANHPARTASGLGVYGVLPPAELRSWHDTAPEVAIGMAGAPGHQAATLTTRGYKRGAYGGHPTMGGFDQLTARLGGFWDAMLGEGRRWWITANSDSHIHYSEGGIDFWPGEYSKTYVLAEPDHASILQNLRAGRVFVTTGDLISELELRVSAGPFSAGLGEELQMQGATQLVISIRVRDPDSANAAGQYPAVRRVDLIVGEVSDQAGSPDADQNKSTRVARRFVSRDWQREGEYLVMNHSMTVRGPIYLRLRGTNTDELEPQPDPANENPWDDLWFYSNPVFVRP